METNKSFEQLLDTDNSLTEEFKTVATKMFQEEVDQRVEAKVSAQTEIIRECVVQQSAEIIEETVNALVEQRCKEYEESMKQTVASTGNTIIKQQLEQYKIELSESFAEKSERIIEEELEKQRVMVAEIASELVEEQVKDLKTKYESEYCKLVEQLVDAEEKIKELENNDEIVEQSADIIEKLVEALDVYADEVAEKFLEKHHLELVEAEKVRCAENFFKDLTEVYAKYCIDVKESCKKDSRKERKLEEAYSRLSEQIEQNNELQLRLESLERKLAFNELTKDLTKVESVRVAKLAEQYNGNIDDYKNRVKYLVESVATKPTKYNFGKHNVVTDKVVVLEEQVKAPKQDADVATVLNCLQTFQNNR